ncbi:hypothetical protein BC941DRAFT_443122 [Chlamydoabsidia padenii]|nr:hypothetical protein BC941DRAFT_443122 [Chlamydoabsidia padenii]
MQFPLTAQAQQLFMQHFMAQQQSQPLHAPDVRTQPLHVPNTLVSSHTTLTPSTPGHDTPLKTKQPVYCHVAGHVVHQFKLKHNVLRTDMDFFISDEVYKKIKLPVNQDAPSVFTRLILNSWKVKTSELKCEWPETARFLINNMEPKLQKKQKLIGAPGEPIRYAGKDIPLDLIDYLVAGTNILTILQDRCACNYFFSVNAYYCQTESRIVNHVTSSDIALQVGEELVDKLLGHNDNKQNDGNNNGDDDDDDIEVIQESVKLNPKCPISMTMIKIPVRGVQCKHPDCFDLYSFLYINTSPITSWKCPFCNNYSPPNFLRRDLYFQHLLDSVPKNTCEITISGSSKHYKVTKADDDAEDMEDTKDDIIHLQCNNNQGATTEPDNVISLLSDNEDDDEDSVDSNNVNNSNDDNGTDNTNSDTGNKSNTDDDGDQNRHKRLRTEEPHYPATSDTPSQWVPVLQTLLGRRNIPDDPTSL